MTFGQNLLKFVKVDSPSSYDPHCSICGYENKSGESHGCIDVFRAYVLHSVVQKDEDSNETMRKRDLGGMWIILTTIRNVRSTNSSSVSVMEPNLEESRSTHVF